MREQDPVRKAAEAGDFRGSLALARRALDLDPKSSEAHRTAGDAALALGQEADAEREYTAALLMESGNAGAEYGLGRLTERQAIL